MLDYSVVEMGAIQLDSSCVVCHPCCVSFNCIASVILFYGQFIFCTCWLHYRFIGRVFNHFFVLQFFAVVLSNSSLF